MAHAIDALVSPTLKHLRQQWWNDEFTEFLTETLRPRPGNRILDVGCGAGEAEVSIGRLHVSQLQQVGIDLKVAEVIAASQRAASHNINARFAAGDGCRLPFTAGAFDATYCVAVLQHVREAEMAVSEFARVTRTGGHVVAVEPDNSAHYAFSSVPGGSAAFALAARLFAAAAADRGDAGDPAIGPRLPQLFLAHRLEPIHVRLFPVSHVILGQPAAEVFEGRRGAVERLLAGASEHVRGLAEEYMAALAGYKKEARAAGSAFVEIQNTMLFATVGQKAA
jgi:SAM-dependent methyltransferase